MDKPKIARVGCGIMIQDGSKVLMGLRNDDAVKADSELSGEGTWTFPGGKYDFHDGLFSGIKREVKEETDLDLNTARVMSISNERVEKAHFITIGWLADEWSGTVKTMEPDEILRWQWFDLDNLPETIFSPTRKMIDNYLSDTFISDEDLL